MKLPILDGPLKGQNVELDNRFMPQTVILEYTTTYTPLGGEYEKVAYRPWEVGFRAGEPTRWVLAREEASVVEYVELLRRRAEKVWRIVKSRQGEYVFINDFERATYRIPFENFWRGAQSTR